MSLRIQVDKVGAVLIGDRWFEVTPGTFNLDAYEFMDGATLIHGGGQGGVCGTGFEFVESRRDGRSDLRVAGPLTSIKAVIYTSEAAQ